MASIDDIWDEPVTTNSPRTPRRLDADDDDDGDIQRPAKRQKQALFLSDSEDEGGGGMKRDVVKAPPPVANADVDVDLEAIFADAEDDDGLNFKGLGDLDVAAMEREAEERHRRPPPLTPHPVLPSSSPPRANDGSVGGPQNAKDKNKGKDTNKRPRPVLLNENLLLGPTGFPDLIPQIKDFKVKGKGREMEDLNRLMRVYNFWTHKLHPKLKFRDTVVRIEKLCHTKRMQVALSVWRDEAHGKIREADGDLPSDSDDDGGEIRKPDEIGVSLLSTTSEAHLGPHSLTSGQNADRNGLSLSPFSRASSQPPTSDFPDDDDVFGPSAPSNLRPNDTLATTSSMIEKSRVVVDSDDEEHFWKELETAGRSHSTQASQQRFRSGPESTQSLDNFDDAEMWAALEGASQPSATAGQLLSEGSRAACDKAGEMDIDDDDMWDIIRENEKAGPALQPPANVPNAEGTVSISDTVKRPSTGNQSVADSEMDWHDMYAD